MDKHLQRYGTYIIILLLLLLLPSKLDNKQHIMPFNTALYFDAVKMDYTITKDFMREPVEVIYQSSFRDNLQSKIVIVTAYNNVIEQTDSTPNICAWGDKIRYGIIAVSRDLEKIGLTRKVRVVIDGAGSYDVLDKMNWRKENQIDIFMGKNTDRAKEFGVKELKIYWKKPKSDDYGI